uniref:SRR1-like domain-containing protein n=1 Tax=Ditylum brightwellii TaxID=49249 RepID=A0A7S4T3Z2_9STRA|mmetsp:Transcript_16070/g.23016  ORF Transcript_16070/g.23016 Transcript_16070/m.23016 type:complete len:423 (+) Transcript_16070:36-1304(+)
MQHTNTNDDEEEEWTFVSSSHSRQKSKKQKPLKQKKKNQNVAFVYNSSSSAATAEQEEEVPNEAKAMKVKEKIERYMTAIETHFMDFIQEMISSVTNRRLCPTNVEEEEGENKKEDPTNACNQKEQPSKLIVTEIICYGIGNFAPTVSSLSGGTGEVSSPLLQLVCLFLLQKHLQQSQESGSKVPIYYYEPLLLPIERIVLANHFSVQIIEENERGKRRANTLPNTYSSSTTTLFYMPHCPMRLYTNVLWTNWDLLLQTSQTNMIHTITIFGNSFLAYDTRIVKSSKERESDDTNGLFRVLPFVKEIDVVHNCITTRKKRKGRKKGGGRRYLVGGGINNNDDDYVNEMENAFHDCTIIWFESSPTANEHEQRITKCHSTENDIFEWPPRPTEYFVKEEVQLLEKKQPHGQEVMFDGNQHELI